MEFMNHPWINVCAYSSNLIVPIFFYTANYSEICPVCFRKAIDGGSPDPTSHQPGSERGEGRMGGCQGEKHGSSSQCLLCS